MWQYEGVWHHELHWVAIMGWHYGSDDLFFLCSVPDTAFIKVLLMKDNTCSFELFIFHRLLSMSCDDWLNTFDYVHYSHAIIMTAACSGVRPVFFLVGLTTYWPNAGNNLLYCWLPTCWCQKGYLMFLLLSLAICIFSHHILFDSWWYWLNICTSSFSNTVFSLFSCRLLIITLLVWQLSFT